MITKRPKRLPGIPYVGYERYFLTTCTDARHRAFADRDAAMFAVEQIRRSGTSYRFAIVAYCVMPDHVHVLAYGAALDASFPSFVKDFKQRSGYWYTGRFGRRLWQTGYYDRVLRNDEATEAVARYVLENPVRAGLTRALGEYPFAGSDLYETSGLISAWDGQT